VSEITWSGSLHQTFRLLPADKQSGNLGPFLEADGLSPSQLLARLPYDRARAGASAGSAPDPKRYRDGKQVYQTVGLLYEDNDVIHITELGATTRRWLSIITPKNRVIIARHAAYALAACQLRNPTGAGSKYAGSVTVFPFAFIWRAMLALDNQLSSDELNRGIFKVQNKAELDECIAKIRQSRVSGNVSLLGPETITGRAKNDRIIPWLSLASFGWTLFPDKGPGDSYQLDPITASVVREASRIEHPHRNFPSVRAYVEHVSRCAALPKDLR
jgi:hypothetical protein